MLVFKEMSFAMGLNSLHTKRALIGKSKNGFIKVSFFAKFRKMKSIYFLRLFVILIIIQTVGFSYGLIMKKQLSLIRKLRSLEELIYVLVVGMMSLCGKYEILSIHNIEKNLR